MAQQLVTIMQLNFERILNRPVSLIRRSLMRIRTIILCLCCLAVLPCVAQGATKNVTIDWTQSGSTEVQGYRMYYSYSSGMANKKLACATSNTNVASLTCNDINLEQSPVYFIIAAVTPEGEKSSAVVSKTFDTDTEPPPPATISPVRDFKLFIPGSNQGSAYAINFQPAGAPIPDGFTVDSGESFDTSRGYGWMVSPGAEGPRDRDNSASPDQSYDTLMLVDTNAKWEISLANGTYSVTICVGDPYWQNTTNVIRAEGAQIVNDTIDSNNKWYERTGTVTVSDGRLTLTFQGSAPYAKICWIKISN